MKPDEQAFLMTVASLRDGDNRKGWKWPRDIINYPEFSMHHKRAWFLLEKWCRKGWYEYGVTLDLGWITEEGMEIARSVYAQTAVS